MEFHFAGYRFDASTLLLFQGNEVVALRNNEAKLLAYFLSHPQKVLSKEQILDAVWAGKVVSEQAVFQAVSNLRQQFGEAAIKTFPKKGYQWQIECAAEAASAGVSQPADSYESAGANALPPQTRAWSRHWRWSALAGLLLLLVAGLLWVGLAGRAKPVTAVPVLLRMSVQAPAQANEADLVARLRNEPGLKVTAVPNTFSDAQLMAAPAHYARTLFKAEAGDAPSGLLLTARLRQHGSKHLLAYSLQGHANRWTGQLSGDSADSVYTQLGELLRRVAPIPLLWGSKDQRLINAQLQLLHNEAPQNLPILRTLVGNLIAIGDTRAAQLRLNELQQLARQAGDVPQEIYALQAQARLAVEGGQVPAAQAALEQALTLARQLNSPSLEAQVLERFFAVYYAQHDFERLEESLLQALRLAQAEPAPAQEADLLFALTIASYKFQQATKQAFYFDQTRALFDKLQLPAESYAELEFFTGLNSHDPAQAERLFKSALQRFPAGLTTPTQERAQQQLVNLYLKQGRRVEALALFEHAKALSAAEQLLLARIHAASQTKLAPAVDHATAAFNAANLSGDYITALDAALFLAEHSPKMEDPTGIPGYREFISKNATPMWTRQNQAALSRLNLP